MENEVWKDITGYEGLYQVSNLGRVKNIKNEKEKIINPSITNVGYYSVGLYKNKNNKTRTYGIHQLVAIAFLGHKPCGHELVIDHINDNRSDNRVKNLQIVTQRFNVRKTQGKYTSKYKGVFYCKKNNKWKAQIYFEKKVKHLGFFDFELEAHLEYQKALKNIENNAFKLSDYSYNYSSNYKGVSYIKKLNKWMSYARINKKTIYLGSFETQEQAHLKRQDTLKKYELC
jgi:hypothetical protein